jgi:hypothetical protein
MTFSPADAWVFARLLADQPTGGELAALGEPWKAMAEYLAGLDVKARLPAWKAMMSARPDRAELTQRLVAVDTLGPAPEKATAATFATMADVAQTVTSQPWLWKGWLALGVLNAVAADPGVGKTRFAMDLARRLWFALSWPDGQPNTHPAGTKTLWVQGDRNFAEMLQLLRDYGMPEEAVALGSGPTEPFGSLDLDDPANLAAIGQRIQAAGVPLAIIDTVGMTTSRNLSRPDEAREFFAPIIEMGQQTGAAVLGLTHLSANKEALGRRIVEKARIVIKMTQPDPEGQRDRRRLWVDKTAVLKPPVLGVTMTTAGNEYDFNPPKEPESVYLASHKPGRQPTKVEECQSWLAERLTPNPVPVKDLRIEAEAAGFAPAVLYRAKEALQVEEYIIDHRKWWKMPLEADGADPLSIVQLSLWTWTTRTWTTPGRGSDVGWVSAAQPT